MIRARPSNLVLASVGLAAAAIIGVQLGQSAISEINPVHFQGPLAPQGITPPPDPAPFDPYGQPYVWSLPPGPSLVDCGAADCAAVEARQIVNLAMDQSAGRDASLPYWRDSTPATELRPWPPGETPNGNAQIQRYMSYPVNREQADRAAAAAAPTPAPAAPAATPAEALRPPAVVPSSSPEPAAAPAAEQQTRA